MSDVYIAPEQQLAALYAQALPEGDGYDINTQNKQSTYLGKYNNLLEDPILAILAGLGGYDTSQLQPTVTETPVDQPGRRALQAYLAGSDPASAEFAVATYIAEGATPEAALSRLEAAGNNFDDNRRKELLGVGSRLFDGVLKDPLEPVQRTETPTALMQSLQKAGLPTQAAYTQQDFAPELESLRALADQANQRVTETASAAEQPTSAVDRATQMLAGSANRAAGNTLDWRTALGAFNAVGGGNDIFETQRKMQGQKSLAARAPEYNAANEQAGANRQNEARTARTLADVANFRFDKADRTSGVKAYKAARDGQTPINDALRQRQALLRAMGL